MQLFAASEYSFKQLLSFTTLQLSKLFSSFTTVDIKRHKALMWYFLQVPLAKRVKNISFALNPMYHSDYSYFFKVSFILIQTTIPDSSVIIPAR